MPRSLSFMAPNTDRDNVALAGLRAKITDLVAQNALSLVQCAIDGVKEEGQYQAIKYLFEMVGIYPAAAGTESDAGDSLAQILLQRLGLEEKSARAVEPKD